jgi:hypothetical protein
MPLDRKIQDELRSHLEMRTAQNIAASMTPEQAHRMPAAIWKPCSHEGANRG